MRQKSDEAPACSPSFRPTDRRTDQGGNLKFSIEITVGPGTGWRAFHHRPIIPSDRPSHRTEDQVLRYHRLVRWVGGG